MIDYKFSFQWTSHEMTVEYDRITSRGITKNIRFLRRLYLIFKVCPKKMFLLWDILEFFYEIIKRKIRTYSAKQQV